jgi:hypothetical protein
MRWCIVSVTEVKSRDEWVHAAATWRAADARKMGRTSSLIVSEATELRTWRKSWRRKTVRRADIMRRVCVLSAVSSESV